jgi:hypothetical protein
MRLHGRGTMSHALTAARRTIDYIRALERQMALLKFENAVLRDAVTELTEALTEAYAQEVSARAGESMGGSARASLHRGKPISSPGAMKGQQHGPGAPS